MTHFLPYLINFIAITQNYFMVIFYLFIQEYYRTIHHIFKIKSPQDYYINKNILWISLNDFN